MPLLVLAGFIGLETWGIIQAIHRFGGGPVLLWLLGAAMAGVWVIAHGGVTAIRRIQAAVQRGELPAAEVFSGLINVFAGLLLILPGFVTDIIAISLLIAGGGIRKRLGEKLSMQVAQARPDLKQPVTLDGEFRRKD